MMECDNPKDNVVDERVNNIIKNELLNDIKLFSVTQVIEAVRNAVALYNNERLHMSLDGMLRQKLPTA